MKIKDLISESSEDISFCLDLRTKHEFVLIKSNEEYIKFLIPHSRFDGNLSVVPVFWHALTGRVIPITPVTHKEAYGKLPIVYIEE